MDAIDEAAKKPCPGPPKVNEAAPFSGREIVLIA
jgi:hypothetical protein